MITQIDGWLLDVLQRQLRHEAGCNFPSDGLDTPGDVVAVARDLMDIDNAITAAALAGGAGGHELISDKSVRRLIGALEQLGLRVNRTDSPGSLSRFRGVKSTAVFRGTAARR